MRNTAVLAAGEIVGKLATLALVIVLARESGERAVGIWVFAQSLCQITTMPMDLGVDRWLLRRIAADPSEYLRQYPGTLAVKAVLLIPSAAVTAIVVLAIGGGTATLATVALMFVGFTLDALVRTNQYVFTAFERGTQTAWSVIVQRFVGAGLGIAALLGGLGVVAAAGAYVVGSAASMVVTYVLLARHIEPAPWRLHLSRWRPVARASMPFAAQDVSMVLLFKLDAVILTAMAGVLAVGSYGTAYRLLESTFFITYSVTAAFSPMFTYLSHDTEPTVGVAYARAVKLGQALLIPVAVALVVLAPELIRFFFGDELASAAAPLRLLAPVVLGLALVNISSSLIVSREHPGRIARVTASMVVLNVALNLALIPALEDRGAALAMLVTEAVFVVVALRLAAQAVGPVHWVTLLAPPVGAGAAMAAVMLALSSIWPVALAAGLTLYVVVLWAIERLVAPEELAEAMALVRRRAAGA